MRLYFQLNGDHFMKLRFILKLTVFLCATIFVGNQGYAENINKVKEVVERMKQTKALYLSVTYKRELKSRSDIKCNKKILNRFKVCIKDSSDLIIESITSRGVVISMQDSYLKIFYTKDIFDYELIQLFCSEYPEKCKRLLEDDEKAMFIYVLKNILEASPSYFKDYDKKEQYELFKKLVLKQEIVSPLAKKIGWVNINNYWYGVESMVDEDTKKSFMSLVSNMGVIFVVNRGFQIN